MQWYEADVRGVEKEIAARSLTAPLVFYGSSSIRLWTTMSGDLGSNDVINLGFGGSTLEACVYFFDRILLAAKPSSLVLYAGDNDLGDGKSSLDVLRFYKAFASKMKEKLPDISYGFISIKPSVARQAIIDKISAANESIQQEISMNPMSYYVDVYSLMLDSDGKPRKDLYQPDGLHLNADGYRLWTNILLQHRDQIFNENFRRFHKE
jgi:lysophospholipase L1-like esterase